MNTNRFNGFNTLESVFIKSKHMKYVYAFVAVLSIENKLCTMDGSFEARVIRSCLQSGNQPSARAENADILTIFAVMGSQIARDLFHKGEVALKETDCRDAWGYSNTGNAPLDARRNLPENGGPRGTLYMTDPQHQKLPYVVAAQAYASVRSELWGSGSGSFDRGDRDGGDLTGRSSGSFSGGCGASYSCGGHSGRSSGWSWSNDGSRRVGSRSAGGDSGFGSGGGGFGRDIGN